MSCLEVGQGWEEFFLSCNMFTERYGLLKEYMYIHITRKRGGNKFLKCLYYFKMRGKYSFWDNFRLYSPFSPQMKIFTNYSGTAESAFLAPFGVILRTVVPYSVIF